MGGSFVECSGETKEKAQEAADQAVQQAAKMGLIEVRVRTEPYQYEDPKTNPLGEQCFNWWFVGLHFHS